MASAHAPCPRAIHVVYPDSLTRHLTRTPHPTRLLLAPTALVAVLSSAIGSSFPPTLSVAQRAVSTGHIHLVYPHSPDRHPQYHRRSHPSRAKPIPACRPNLSHPRAQGPHTHHLVYPALIRPSPAIPPTLSPLTSQAPHRGRSLPRTSARVHVPCVCRASRQHQLRAIDRSARRTRCQQC